MTRLSLNSFFIVSLFLSISAYSVKAIAASNQVIHGNNFDIHIERKDNPLSAVDSEFMHVLKRREGKKAAESIVKKYHVRKEEAGEFYAIKHKEVTIRGKRFGMILIHDLKSGRKNYQILGVNKQLISIRCLGKLRSNSNAMNSSCSNTVKKVFSLSDKGIEQLFKEDPMELGSPLSNGENRSNKNEKASSENERNFFTNFSNLKNSTSNKNRKSHRDTAGFSSKPGGKSDECRDTTLWGNVVVKPSELASYRAKSILESEPAKDPVRLYCKKAKHVQCNKERSWLNYQEYLIELFGHEIANRQIESTSQQVRVTNGKYAETLCLRLKKTN
jgi:hypothetical protein